MILILPFIIPFMAVFATCSTEVVTIFSFFSGEPEYLAAELAKFVLKSPGNNTLQVTPLPFSSLARVEKPPGRRHS